jgi:hypothetical protein
VVVHCSPHNEIPLTGVKENKKEKTREQKPKTPLGKGNIEMGYTTIG